MDFIEKYEDKETWCKFCYNKINPSEPRYYNKTTGFGPICMICAGADESHECSLCGGTMVKDLLGSKTWICWDCGTEEKESSVFK